MPMEHNVGIAYTNFMPQQFAQMGSGLVQAAAGLAQAAAGLAEAAKIMQIAAGAHLPANQPVHSNQLHPTHFCPPPNFSMPNFAMPPFMPTFDNCPEIFTDITKPISDENSTRVAVEPLILNEQCLRSDYIEEHVECVEATDNTVEIVQCSETLEKPEEVAVEPNVQPEPAFQQQNRRSSEKRAAKKKKKDSCKATAADDVLSTTKNESDQQNNVAVDSGKTDAEEQQRALPAENAQVLHSCSSGSAHASLELPLPLCDRTTTDASSPQSPKQRKKSKSTASGGKDNSKLDAQIKATNETAAEVLEKVGDALHTCEEKHYSLSLDNFEYVENELKKVDLTADGVVEAVIDMVFDAACNDLAAVGLCAQMICSMTYAQMMCSMTVEPNDSDDSIVELIRERVTWRIERAFRNMQVVKVLKKNHAGPNAKQEEVQTALLVVNQQFGATIQLACQLYVEQYYRDQIISVKALLQYMERLMPNPNSDCDFETKSKCSAGAKQKLKWLCDLIMHVGHILASEDADINAEPLNILGRLNELCCQKAVDLDLKNEIEKIIEWHKSGWDSALARTYVKRKFDSRGRDVQFGRMPIYMPTAENVAPVTAVEKLLPNSATETVQKNAEPTGNVTKIAATLAAQQKKGSKFQKKAAKTFKVASVPPTNTPAPSAKKNGDKAIFLRNCRERMIRFMPLSDSCEPPDEKYSKSITWIVERCKIDDDIRNENLEFIYENLHIMLITIGLENFHDAVTQLDHIFSEWYGDDMVEIVVDMIFDVACTPGYFENIGMYAELILFLMTFGPIENSNGEHVWKLVRDKLMLLIQQKFARFDELDAVITNKKSDAKLIDENMKSWNSEGFNGAIQFLGQLYLEQWFADQILSPKKLLKYLNRLLPNRKRDFTQAGKCTEFAEKKLEWLCELIMNVGHVLVDEGGDIDAEPLRILMRFENLCEQNAVSDKLRSVLQEVINWHHSGWNRAQAHRSPDKWIMLEGPIIKYRLI